MQNIISYTRNPSSYGSSLFHLVLPAHVHVAGPVLRGNKPDLSVAIYVINCVATAINK